MEKIKALMQGIKRGYLALTAMLSVMLLGSVALAGSASATPPADPVDDAFDTLTTKTNHYGGLVVALAVVAILILFGLVWLRKGAKQAK